MAGPIITIKSIKAGNYSPEYAKRLIRGVRKSRKEGVKFNKQKARGKKEKEHIERRKRELEKNKITDSQLRSVRAFLKRFNSSLYKGIPDESDLVEYVRKNGYESFVRYRATWDKYRKEYLKKQAAHELTAGGSLGYILDDIYGGSGLGPPSDNTWLYYH